MEFLNKHFKGVVLILLFLTTGITGVFKVIEFVSPKTAGMSKAVMEEVFGPMMDRKLAPLAAQVNTIDNKVTLIEKNQPKVQESVDVRLMDFHLNNMETVDTANDQISMWEDGLWGSQLIALKYVARNPDAMEYLERVVANEAVFKVFKIRASKYR